MNPLRRAACAMLFVLSACVVGVRAPLPPPPPPPPEEAPAPLSRSEAVRIAIRAAEQRGIEGGSVKKARLHHDEWRIDLRAAPPRKGRFAVRIDAWTGRILRIDDHVRSSDDDDDE